jgi:transcriptional regulator with XRE-family HTH domain
MQQTWEIRSGADLGRAIADIRRDRGMSQKDVATETELTRAYLAQIEAGRTVSLLERTLRVLRRLGAHVTVTFEPETSDG